MTPLNRSRKTLKGVDVRRLLAHSGLSSEIATAIADLTEEMLRWSKTDGEYMRNHYAGLAMQAALVGMEDWDDANLRETAHMAYVMADAMLREKNDS